MEGGAGFFPVFLCFGGVDDSDESYFCVVSLGDGVGCGDGEFGVRSSGGGDKDGVYGGGSVFDAFDEDIAGGVHDDGVDVATEDVVGSSGAVAPAHEDGV